jgi:uncharacterized protein with HEPN domain
LDDELRQSAVLQKSTTVGEAAGHQSNRFRNNHPNIEWRTLLGAATSLYTNTSRSTGGSYG